jgi:hypothetical protein
MGKILFADEYHDRKVELRTPIVFKRMLVPATVIALLAALILAFTKAFIFSFIFLFEAIVCIWVIKRRSDVVLRTSESSYSRRRNTYLRIYEDRIVVKKPWGKEKVYHVSPMEYTVTLSHGGGRASWARLVYVFGDKHGKRILRYASDTWASNYKVLGELMKYDVRGVGCRNVFDMVGIFESKQQDEENGQ